MPLPINFNASVKSKLDDAALLKKMKVERKKSELTNNMLDVLEKIRQDIAEHLDHKKNLFELVTSADRLEEYIMAANKYGKVALDTETTGLNPLVDEIIGFSMYFPGEKAIYVPVTHEDYLTGARLTNQIPIATIIEILSKLTVDLILHNAPFDLRVILHCFGIKFKCCWDTQVAATLINENESHRLKDLHSKYISHEEEQTFAEYFKHINYRLVPLELAYPYAANDAIDTWDMYDYQYNQQGLNEQSDMWWLYTNIELPMIEVVIALSENGVAVDRDKLDEFRDKYHEEMDESLKACYDEIALMQGKIDTYLLNHPESKLKQPINIGSATQLAIIFYDILGVKAVNKEKPRAMDEKVLLTLAEKYPLAEKIVAYRKNQKLTSTYLDNMYNIIHTDGRVHTGFNSNGAKTGRMSSREPLNLQNIPARGHGKKLRQMFVGQTTEREVELRSDNAYILGREEEVQLQDGTWVWAELVKAGDVLESGEVVKTVIVKDFKVLIGIEVS